MALSSSSRQALALAIVALIGAGVALSGSLPDCRGVTAAPSASRARHSPPPPAGSAELALFAPMVPGSSFEGWTIRHISAVHEGAIRIALERNGERASLTVHASKGGPPPPVTAGPYAIYYSSRDAAEGDRLSKALALVLGRHLAEPVPDGLSGFREESRRQ